MDPTGEGGSGYRPRPMPLPVAAPRARKRPGVVIAVVAALVVLVLCSCCGVPLVLGPAMERWVGPALQKRADSAEVRRSMLPLSVAWVGGARYAVVQSVDATGLARVVVWERASGRTKTVVGYRFIAGEETTPVAWLVRDDPDAQPDLLELQGGYAWWDTVVPDVYRLDLADPSARPSRVLPGLWNEWPNGKGTSARLEVHPSDGALPSALSFWKGGKRISDALIVPPAVTLRPVGWSPSGERFAAVGLPEIGGEAGITVSMFDPATGESEWWELAVEPKSRGTFRVEWDPERDKLWWYGTLEGEPKDATGFRSIGREGEMDVEPTGGYVDGMPQTTEPTSVRGVSGEFVGVRKMGPVFYARDGVLWCRDHDFLRRMGRLSLDGTSLRPGIPAESVDYDEDAGVVWSTMLPSADGDFEKIVVVNQPDGSQRTVIWRETAPNPGLKLLGLDKLVRP